MAKRETRVTEHSNPFPSLPSRGGDEWLARRRGRPVEQLWWPMEPDVFVTVFGYADPYAVTVGFVRPGEGKAPIPTEISIRLTFPMTEGRRRFEPDLVPAPISPRDVRRLPLDRIVRAATVTADRGPIDAHEENRRILVPRGRPKGERAITFYKEVADFYRDCVSVGISPARELAKRKNTSENTAYQWIHQARKRGFLEPSPRSRGGTT